MAAAPGEVRTFFDTCCVIVKMADSEAFDFEALDEESELSAGIIAQDDGQLSELARFVTVLSDFGETEQFIIEGDSLILIAFEDERLDWKLGKV